jgi:O-acetyl-ADP-ribose deacetylase (regulator of RNase III)
MDPDRPDCTPANRSTRGLRWINPSKPVFPDHGRVVDIDRTPIHREASMIHEVSGDILLSNAHAVAHGVAPNDPFHSGLALELRELAPAMYKDFRHYCHDRHPKPGDLWAWTGADGRHLVALFTQDGSYDHGGKPGKASAAHVGHALKALRKLAEAEGIRSLALPRLATGVGGMDWAEVRPLIEQHLGDLAIPVYVYTTYHKGQRAAEAV